MTALDSLHGIPIDIEGNATTIGNLKALLAEIAAHLENLIARGETAAIDLHNLPLAPAEYERLRGLLAASEVIAQVEAIGPTEVVETRFAGVWWLTHYNVEGDIVADVIEITHCPVLLSSPAEDVAAGLAQLQALLAEDAP